MAAIFLEALCEVRQQSGQMCVVFFLPSRFAVGHRDSRLRGISEMLGHKRAAWKMMGTIINVYIV